MSNRQWTPIKTYGDILFEMCNGVAKITINRPEVYNAFRPETNVDMMDAMDVCRERGDIRVVILTGVGDKAFLQWWRPRTSKVLVAMSVKTGSPV